MRGKVWIAAIALIMIASLAGCNKSTAGNVTRDIERSTRSVIERNGINNDMTEPIRDSKGNIIGYAPDWNDKLENWRGITGEGTRGTLND